MQDAGYSGHAFICRQRLPQANTWSSIKSVEYHLSIILDLHVTTAIIFWLQESFGTILVAIRPPDLGHTGHGVVTPHNTFPFLDRNVGKITFAIVRQGLLCKLPAVWPDNGILGSKTNILGNCWIQSYSLVESSLGVG